MTAGGVYGRSILAVLSFAGLAACTVQPIKTAPRWEPQELVNPGIEGGQKPAVLSYCYSSQINEPSQVLEYAREDCPTGKLYFKEDDVLWTKCPLIQPVRATFLCYPATPGEAEQSLKQSPKQFLPQ